MKVEGEIISYNHERLMLGVELKERRLVLLFGFLEGTYCLDIEDSEEFNKDFTEARMLGKRIVIEFDVRPHTEIHDVNKITKLTIGNKIWKQKGDE